MKKLRRYVIKLHLAALLALALSFALASAGQMLLLGAGKPADAGGGGLVYTATDAQGVNAGFTTTGSFTAAIGTASTDRIVNVGFQSNSNISTLAVTFNGSGATKDIADTVSNNASIWHLNVPAGTSVTIGWTNATGVGSIAIVVSTISGQSGGGSATPTTASFTGNNVQPIGPLSVTVAAGGVAFLSGEASNAGASAPTFTWTGTTSTAGDLTTFVASSIEVGSAHMTASSTNVTVSSTAAMSFAGPSILAVIWAP